ncbi:MAG: Cof-type HAD-IIB family hydrolase [Candidatus Bathyarchaeota archaeon]|nr:Cof-type HAD-IIB family hydrolase [Candidatus Termiticorpusculum sp.]
MKKIVVLSDIDGTLLDTTNNVPQVFQSFLEKLRMKNIDLYFATSRSPQNVLNLLKEYNISYYAICSDGASFVKIEQQNMSIVHEENLSQDETCKILDALCNVTFAPFLLFTNHSNNYDIISIETQMSQDGHIYELLSDGRKIVNYATFEQVIDKKEIINSVRAISFFNTSEVIDRVYEQLSSNTFFKRFKLYRYRETRLDNNSYSWLDIMPQHLSKGAVVSKFMDTVFNETFIIGLGNDINDLEMLKLSNISFCPINSNSIIKHLHGMRVINHCNGNDFLLQIMQFLEQDI